MGSDKKEIILDAMRALFQEGKAGTASVSDIARKAGIAKGLMYYYFRSKEEVMDALVLREYADIIRACDVAVEQSGGSALRCCLKPIADRMWTNPWTSTSTCRKTRPSIKSLWHRFYPRCQK